MSDNHEPVTYRDFAVLARRRNWTPESLAERFKGKIESPSEFFHRVMSGKHPNIVIPFRSVLSFYSGQLQSQEQLGVSGRPACACGCGHVVYDRKKWAMPGCRTRARRKNVRNQQFWLGQLVNFVGPRLRPNRGFAVLPLTPLETVTNG